MEGKRGPGARTREALADLEGYLRFLDAHHVGGVRDSDAVRRLMTTEPSSWARRPREDGQETPTDDPEFFRRPWTPPARVLTLDEVRAAVGDCRRCKLARGRTKLVFGVGDPKAELMFVGEGPGADEDRKGEPFVGKAGQLLDRMIAAMGKARADVYIANVVKCRPPENREPEPDEVHACIPFLVKQIESIAPKVICALGGHAAKALLDTREPISKLRGRFHYYERTKLLPTFHPAYLLRNPPQKKTAWEDLQKIMAELGWPMPRKAEGSEGP
jgi:DNA polymerase